MHADVQDYPLIDVAALLVGQYELASAQLTEGALGRGARHHLETVQRAARDEHLEGVCEGSFFHSCSLDLKKINILVSKK